MKGQNMREKFVYALDLSLNSTGICIFTNDGRFVEAMTIDTHKETETKFKLKLIGEKFIELIRKYSPELVVIEQGFTLFNKSTQAIFRVHGVANYIFCSYEQIYYPATIVKKTCGGAGNLKKEELREIIRVEYPDIEFKTLDESDAFAIGRTYFIKKGIDNAKKNVQK
jgi:Holliday junction resolvasome RuvABC endonuclease subunit